MQTDTPTRQRQFRVNSSVHPVVTGTAAAASETARGLAFTRDEARAALEELSVGGVKAFPVPGDCVPDFGGATKVVAQRIA